MILASFWENQDPIPENIRIVKPQFAEQIELQLIQLFQSGRLRGATPLPDKEFKKIATEGRGIAENERNLPKL